MLAIFNKEFRAYFTSATGYIFMSFFLIMSGIYFSIFNLLYGDPSYTSVLGSIMMVLLIGVPLITMRLLSEETKQKTDQLILTAPIRLSGVVLGKYFAALALLALTLLLTGIQPIIISLFGTVAVGELFSGYLGFFLLGAAFIAIGLFISSLTDNQVVAALVTFATLLLLMLMDGIQQALPKDRTSSIVFVGILIVGIALLVYFSIRNIYVSLGLAVIGFASMALIYVTNKTFYDGILIRFFDWFSLLKRYSGFSMGIFDLSAVVYYITFSAALLFLTIQMIEKRRWS
ncbi:MAG: ABC transporter permease [Epulopiscium sp.]|nr:ABC transporter permease [Candidatus Epulonipiscium sp.]